ncbi:unnamed protein product [Paramecium pentaurelia]|uniref:Poly(A) RNA polymerase mitochondrial-like central palm domain-containing protein n=1 Tax=Paramecium pentaurelia TaxID=43138 RepID=A0A8S1WZ00_9CILI|nr:unnamed protein product [Paramecium pentaurelia]
MNQIFYPLTQVYRTSTRQINKVIYYSNPLPEIKLKSNDLKQSIFDWLRQLNQEQLEEVLSFTSYFRVYSYLKMFKIDQNGLHEYQELLCSPFEVNVVQELNRYYSIQNCKRLNKIDLNAHKYILDHIYVSDYEWLFDTITLRGDVEQIINSFEAISKGTIFTNCGQLESYEDEGYFEINLKKQKVYQTLSELLVEEFQIAILLKYRQFQDGTNYTYHKNILNLNLVRFNYLSLNLNQAFLEFKQLFTQQSNHKQLINELNLIQSWNEQIKLNPLQYQILCQEVQHYFNQPKELFQVPIKQVLNEYVLFCKYLISKTLLKEFPLTQALDIKRIKPKQDKQTQQQLQQLNNLFKNSSKSKILPENDQRLFSTNNEEIENNLYEYTTSFMKRLMDETFLELENQKKFKKQKQKKAKNQKKQYMSECTSNCTEYQQLQQQQEIQFDEEWINDTQTKNQKKKQRRKENQEKKKIKKLPEIQQVESSESVQTQQFEPSVQIEIQKEEQQIQEQVQEILLYTTTSTHDDDGEFIEVTKKKFNGKKKKQNNKKEKEQKEDQVEKQVILMKKSNSSQQNYLSDDYKMGNTTPTKTLSQKKEQENIPQKPGLVKSASKEQKTYKYDLDKEILEKIYQSILEHKISRDIQSIYQKEQDNLLKFRTAREIAILRVQHIIKAHFFQFQVEPVIFGSSRTGLALYDSDVDMVVFGLPVFTKAQLFDPMRKLLEVFSQMKWAINYKHIFQATIPLLKITIDPSVGFLEFVGNPLYYVMNHRNIDQFNLKYGELSQNIQIDITFELQQPYPMYGYQGYHVGLLSTDYQRQIGNSVKGFTEVAIVLKKFLKQRGLNDSYTGGVSSFCLTIMLAAIGENVTLGDKLLQFLQRYGWNFDPEKQYISLHSEEIFMPIQNQGDRLPLNIISPINDEKIQIYVSKIQEILQIFKELYLELKENMNQIAISLQKKLEQKELLQLYQTNIEKLVDLIQWQNTNLLDSQF